MSQIRFEPVPSVVPFVFSDALISLIMGPVGSTKTTGGLMKLAYHAKRMAACRDGIRRSRAVWVRNTREQLRDTSIPDFLKWFPDGVYGQYYKSDYKFDLRFDDVECEVLFRGLDDQNDIRRLLSLQASFAILEEFREIHPDIHEAVQTRLGRYPDGMMVPHRPEWGLTERGDPVQGCVTDDGKPNKLLWGMSNPPDADTYWEEFISNPPPNAHITIQPSGLSPEADWVHLLPPNYYEDIAEGKSQDFIDVFVHAKFGKSLQGRPVFRCFDRDRHVAKEPLRSLGSSILIGMDAGLNPTATLGQLAYDGRLMVPASITGLSTGMGAMRFLRERLKPLLASRFPGIPVTIILDPAAWARSQTDERTVADICKSEGFATKPARTNALSARIAAVEYWMTRTIDGKPAILLDPQGCCGAEDAEKGGLIAALRSKYRYKMNTKRELDDTPEKNHPWSDYADSLEYLCMEAAGGAMPGGRVLPVRREIKKAPFRLAAIC